jgi:hypothetical protein
MRMENLNTHCPDCSQVSIPINQITTNRIHTGSQILYQYVFDCPKESHPDHQKIGDDYYKQGTKVVKTIDNNLFDRMIGMGVSRREIDVRPAVEGDQYPHQKDLRLTPFNSDECIDAYHLLREENDTQFQQELQSLKK